jgi:hypothetical protein
VRLRKPLTPLGCVAAAGAAALALVSMVLVVGAARAAQGRGQADAHVTVAAIRKAIGHYRTITWDYQHAARIRRSRTSFADRRSRDRAFLQWTLDIWTRRAYVARSQALHAIHRRLAVALPHPPGLHASLRVRVAYSRRLTLRLRRIYPGTPSRALAGARGGTRGRDQLVFWQLHSARAALAVALHGVRQPRIPDWLGDAFRCIHAHEAGWEANTGNGYYGGLQMDLRFQGRYGRRYLGRWGTADNWPIWAQLETAARGYQARGFVPWPNSARACGLL